MSKSAESNLPRTLDCAEAAGEFQAGSFGEKSLLLPWLADQLSPHRVLFTLPDKYLTLFFRPPQKNKNNRGQVGEVKGYRGATLASDLPAK